ncbi:MAG: hypothetical protein JKY95_19285 [Planctomycetaceae bacterium]|nr:hypothetical protein [Planctomycetaceae bacterium]
MTRQICIFAPNKQPFGNANWSNTILGHIIKPLVEKYNPEWYWFSRYTDENFGSINTDFDSSKIPVEFFNFSMDGTPVNSTMIRFRFKIESSKSSEFEKESVEQIQKMGCASSGCCDYGFDGELGGPRFNDNYIDPNQLAGDEKTHAEESNKRRAILVGKMFHSISELTLDSLDGPDSDNVCKSTTNNHPQNINDTSWDSIHHIFCNTTATPTRIHVWQYLPKELIHISTDWDFSIPEDQKNDWKHEGITKVNS